MAYLQGLLEGVSQSFTKNFHFIDSVKAYLSYALLRASVSSSPIVFQVTVLHIDPSVYFIVSRFLFSWRVVLHSEFAASFSTYAA